MLLKQEHRTIYMIKKILVSQPAPATPKSPYAEIAEKYGVEFTFRPFIKVVGVSVNDFRKQRVDILAHTAIVFTSRHAITHFFKLCEELRVKMPETMKYFATSESVALYIQKFVQYRKRKVFFGPTGKPEDLVPVMAKHKSEKFLVPQNDSSEGSFFRKLDEQKLRHTDCVMYRTESVPVTKVEISAHGMVVLFTAAGVETLVNSYPGFEQGTLRIATLGNAARIAAEEKGLRVDVVAPLPQQPSITGAIARYLEEEAGRDRSTAPQSVTNEASAEQELKLRRSVAAKKGAETKRQKQTLTENLQRYTEAAQESRTRAEEVRARAESLKRESDSLKKQIDGLQKNYEELRHQYERAQREAERARREMREAQSKADKARAELDDLEAQIAVRSKQGNGSKAKPQTVTKKVALSAAKAKPKTAAVTVKKRSSGKK